MFFIVQQRPNPYGLFALLFYTNHPMGFNYSCRVSSSSYNSDDYQNKFQIQIILLLYETSKTYKNKLYYTT